LPLLAAVAIIVLVWFLYSWFRDSSLVRVRHVEVSGLTTADRPAIRKELIDAAKGMTTLHMRARALEHSVSAYPIVHSISVSPHFPSTLRIRVHEYEPVALLAVAPEAAILLVARGAQGVPRDWDMHVGAALVITLASAVALLAAWRRRGAAGSLAPVLTTALASALALWGTHVSAPRQMARIQLLLSNRAAWSDAAWARAHDFLGVLALQQERPEDAIRELEAAAAVAPNPRFFFQIGLAHRMLMRSDLARAAFEKAQALDPRLADAWVGFALLAFDDRDWHRVEACAESALAIAPHRRDAKEIRDNARRAIEAGIH